ncbi:uncharacterized protein SCHCODRAFT_02610133 [Schizophyllum commune H4-8]|nr:uncharacterized protein SCHCODRAFT_02610133 [Schizophyllum commune H4-8]KAI5897753.1 hypothetical protein SCHCODRAFT_02610133 [Schizophyllum commune H4-8]
MEEPMLSPQAPPLDRPVHRKWAASFAAGTVGPIAPYGSSSDLDSVCPCQTRYKEAHFPVPSRRRLARLSRRLSASPNALYRWALLYVSLSFTRPLHFKSVSLNLSVYVRLRQRPLSKESRRSAIHLRSLAPPRRSSFVQELASLYVALRLLQGFLSA